MTTVIQPYFSNHPHKIILEFDSRGQLVEEIDIANWLLDNMGDTGIRWRITYSFKYNIYHFSDEEDAVLFALRWS